MTADQNSTEKMREEILTDARKEGKEVALKAENDAKAILNTLSAEAHRLREEQLEQARAEALRQGELVLATVSIETGRLRAARVEALLESVREEACQRLLDRKGFEYRETVIALASDAIGKMSGDEFVVRLSGADQTIFGEGLAGEIAQRVGRDLSITVSYDLDIKGGGVVIEDAEARQVWDNSLTKRLERMWPEMRRQIARQANFIPGTGAGGGGS